MKRLKIYSTLLLVVLIVLGIFNTCSFSSDTCDNAPNDYLEVGPLPQEYYTTDSILGGVLTSYVPTISYTVYVRRIVSDNMPVLFSVAKDPQNAAQSRTCVIELRKVDLKFPMAQCNKVPLGIVLFGFVIGSVLFIWVFIMVYKIIRSFRRGEIFVSQVSKYLHRTGWMMVAYYLLSYLGSYIVYLSIKESIQVAQYIIVHHCETSIWMLIMGLVLLVISQVILMGKDLKEEQELTI